MSGARGTVLIAASAAVDAVAAGILLVDPRLLPVPGALVAAASHGAAVLLLSRVPRARPSRRWLSVASMLAVPCAGAGIAAAALLSKGRGTVVLERSRRARRRSRLTPAGVLRLRDALPPCDALVCGDEDQRSAALAALSRRSDSEAIALLRWAASGNDYDLAAAAAQVLDEIGVRAEGRSMPRNRSETAVGSDR